MAKKGASWRLLTIVLFTSTLVSHATTAFIVVAAVTCAYLIRTVKHRRAPAGNKSQLVRSPVLLFIVLFTAWLFWNALGTTETLLRAFETQASQIFLLDRRVEGVLNVRTTSNIYPLPPRIRMAVLGLFVIIILLCVSYSLLLRIASRIHKSHKASNSSNFAPALPISLFIVSILLAAADILTFGGIFYDRNILSVAIVAPIFAIGFIGILQRSHRHANHSKRVMRRHLTSRIGVILSICLFIAAFANFATVFYQEDFYIVSDASFSARDFVGETSSSVVMIKGGLFPGGLGEFQWGGQGDNLSRLVVLDIHSELWSRQWLGIEEYDALKNESKTMNQIYSNGEYEVFWQRIS